MDRTSRSKHTLKSTEQPQLAAWMRLTVPNRVIDEHPSHAVHREVMDAFFRNRLYPRRPARPRIT
jgi:hypothetical protein